MKFPYLINEKININGRQIYCKVTGTPGSAHDNQPFVLAITGGPGFGHEMTEASMKYLLPLAQKEKASLPHFIFYDHLGCGKSDKAQDPDTEYTIDHFTDLAGDLVQAIKDKLNLKQMNLYVEGGSFGSLVAMNFPARKAEWLAPDSEINLKQVTSMVGPKGSGSAEYTFNFLAQHYANHPNYQQIVAAQRKLLTGTIKDQQDYIQNFVFPMGTLYYKDIDKSFLYKLIKPFLAYPKRLTATLDATNRFFKALGIEIESLAFADTTLGKCSIDVLNHFFKKDFNGFDLIETVKKNKDFYQKIPICLIAACEDHVVDYRVSEEINKELPDSSAVILFDTAHMITKGPNKEIFHKLNYDLLVKGSIPADDLNYPVIAVHTVSAPFRECLAHAHYSEPATKFKAPQSTVSILASISNNTPIEMIELSDDYIIEEPMVRKTFTSPSELEDTKEEKEEALQAFKLSS